MIWVLLLVSCSKVIGTGAPAGQDGLRAV